MPKIKINDISMYYEIHGHGEPVVFISGFGADHLGWSPILDKFIQDYQVIFINNRGAGQTDVPQGPYTIEQMAADVFDLCNILDIKQAHFIRNSMGGYIVQTLAYHYPELAKSIVLSNSAMQTLSSFHVYASAHIELMKAQAPIELLMKAMCSWAFSYDFLMAPNVLDNLIEWGKNTPYPTTIAGYEGQYQALDIFNSHEWAQHITARTLVLTSDKDIILPTALSASLAHQIKKSRYHCFKNCGHLPHIEQPNEYASIVKAFLINGVSVD